MEDFFKIKNINSKQNIGKNMNLWDDKLKEKILSHPKIAAIVNKLKLSKEQIALGFNYLSMYYDHLIKNADQEPQWKLKLNNSNLLEIDFSNVNAYKKQIESYNFWLTNISPLDDDIQDYFNIPEMSKPRSILIEANKALSFFDQALQNIIKIITTKPYDKGLLLVDENYINSRKIMKYLSFLYGTSKHKTVIFVDIDNLMNFYSLNLKNQEVIAEVNSLLMEVEYLFLNKLGTGTKPEWFINILIDILIRRETNKLPVFISSLADITDKNVSIVSSFGRDKNAGLIKLENLFRNTIARITHKFIAKKS